MSGKSVDGVGMVMLFLLLVLAESIWGASPAPECRAVYFEPGRPSSARVSLELTWPDATSTPAQRYDCACREWP